MAEVRELSMAHVDPDTARRRAERAARHRRREGGSGTQQRYSPEELSRRQQPSRWASQQAQLTESRLRQHDGEEAHVEHQPSLRSLLSASDAQSPDVRAEILQAILAEGALDGIDLENLTTEQEEELTDRIAEAYRRRERRRDRSRDRSRNRERRDRDSRSPQPASGGAETRSRNQAQSDAAAAQQQQPRTRPPVSRPHLFEQTLQEPSRGQRRSASSTSQRSNRSATRNNGTTPASRSATDLSQQPSTDDSQRESRRRLSPTRRSITNPEGSNMREQIHRLRTNSNNARPDSSYGRQPQGSQPARSSQRDAAPRNNSSSSLPRTPPRSAAEPQQIVHPAQSTAAFAPEAVSDHAPFHPNLSISCNRCQKPDIQHDLHYDCQWCLEGAFNLCLRCYRAGQGCNHWFGFGFRAYDRWYRNAPPEGWPPGYERPHVLTPRRYIKAREGTNEPEPTSGEAPIRLQEGAFCESCFTFANDCYWYCNVCLEGAWGFCDNCVKQGRHCTHPLMLVAHIGMLRQPHYDPTKVSFVGLPHLRQESYVTLPVTTHCDVCHRPITPNSTRLHCYKCNNGDYDICNECYRTLVVQGKISQANGINCWRRCLQGHRMAVIGYQDTLDGGHLRITVREPVGGWTFKEDEVSMSSQIPSSGLPPDGGVGMRCLAIYNYFPNGDVADELAFPKNAEVREVENRNGDWFWGVYAGTINLFPSNHVRILQ